VQGCTIISTRLGRILHMYFTHACYKLYQTSQVPFLIHWTELFVCWVLVAPQDIKHIYAMLCKCNAYVCDCNAYAMHDSSELGNPRSCYPKFGKPWLRLTPLIDLNLRQYPTLAMRYGSTQTLHQTLSRQQGPCERLCLSTSDPSCFATELFCSKKAAGKRRIVDGQ